LKPRHLTLAIMLVLTGSGAVPPGPAGAQTSRPNILIILTDDQRQMDTMQVMPRTQQWFGQRGTTFTNAYAATPVCCPSRAAIMTGRFAHNNGVKTNTDAHMLQQDSTLQAQLQAAGYRTALVGKYLNGWPVESDPLYFDKWHLLIPQPDSYFGNPFNNNGTLETEDGYSTDVIRDYAVDLIESDVGGLDLEPWFMLVTPFAPHHPWEAAARHESADVGTWSGNPAVFEADKSDKPRYVRKSKRDYARALVIRDGQLRSLMAADELVDEIFETLEAEDEQNTLAFFLSDNGFMWSEHGLAAKSHPYTESIRVPMFARWPSRIPEGRSDDSFVANIDLAPTILEAAGLTADPSYPMDGLSLLRPGARMKMLNEGWTGARPWASIRTRSYQYIEYYRTFGGGVRGREYYDLNADPYQLKNYFGDTSLRNDPYPAPLSRELAEARACVGSDCTLALERPGVASRCTGIQGQGRHHLVGSDLPDRIRGTRFRDIACGLLGDDVLRTGGGNDLLLGGEGSDVLWGGPGNDVLTGHSGHDVCIGGPGKDRFRGCERVRDKDKGKRGKDGKRG
jgi:arylsulfatase A-like enzyme